MDTRYPVRSATVKAPTALAAFQSGNFLLLDPDHPKGDPNELLRQQGGRLNDPRTMNHNCPVCHRTMTWELFKAHFREEYIKWRSVVIDVTKRKFPGASPKDVTNG